MAVIGSIRKRSGLLIVLIGISIIGFLLMDATNSQFGVLRGTRDTAGKVNGVKIADRDLNARYNTNRENMQAQYERQGRDLTDMDQDNLQMQTWNELVDEIILGKVYKKAGIEVTAQEMSELATGKFPHRFIVQNFTNPQTGQFDPNVVRMVITNLDNTSDGTKPGEKRSQWLNFEASLKKDQLQQKYSAIISKGLTTPSWMNEASYNDQTRTVDFRYVMLPYNEINDNEVKISDDDLKEYLNKNAGRFKQDEEYRKLQYIAFDLKPSGSDSMNTLRSLNEKLEEFKGGATASDDSAFVKLFSEQAFDEVYYTKEQIMSPVKDTLFAVPVKTVIGPYLDGGAFKYAKVSDRKMISDSVHVREIVFTFKGMKQDDPAVAAKFKLIDSVFKAIDSLGADFGLMAAIHSDDANSKMRGGDIGWVKMGEKEKQYNDLIFYRAQKGKAYRTVVAAEDAIHIVQVVEDRPTKSAVLATYYTRSIVPSQETQRNIYGEANKFVADNNTQAKFLEAGKKLGTMRPADYLGKDAFNIPGIGSSRQLVRWAYQSEPGAISAVTTIGNKYVVALLEQVRPKGTPSLDAVREEVKMEVLREKKYEMLAKKINDAKAANIDDLAAKLGKMAMNGDKATFARPVNGEGTLVAVALTTPAGKLSAPVKGQAGVFALQTVGVTEPAKQTDYSVYGMMMKQQTDMKANMATTVHKKMADIQDDRLEF
jgi:peptidyl-prolyl cis-trans isomerase D